MRKTLITTCALAAALAVPVAAMAVTPTSTDKTNAAKTCRGLRTASGRDAFATMFGTNANKRNAFGKCVSKESRENARQDEQAHSNAVTTCRAEQSQDPSAFDTKYGTNANHRNAFGKCVSQHAAQNEQVFAQEDHNQVNAARTCRAARHDDPSKFATDWGTRRNAFGKCVSHTAQQLNQEDEQSSDGQSS